VARVVNEFGMKGSPIETSASELPPSQAGRLFQESAQLSAQTFTLSGEERSIYQTIENAHALRELRHFVKRCGESVSTI
jgi:hypothetical protein